MTHDQPFQSTMQVRDIMTAPVHRVDMDDTLLTVKKLFDRVRCHHVVVLDDKHVFGVVSDRDILKFVSPFAGHKMLEREQDVNTLKKRVHQIMSRDIVTVAPNVTVTEAAQKMLREGVSCLPVVDENKAPLGIVTSRDLVAWAAGMLKPRSAGAEEVEQDENILIIIDGHRCYSPDNTLGRLIRNAEASFEKRHGKVAAQAHRLCTTSEAPETRTVRVATEPYRQLLGWISHPPAP